MGIRAEQQARRDGVVMAAATELFWKQGYTATTIPKIAAKAGVAVGTVAKVGSKDALFLRAWEERSTAISLDLIAQVGTTLEPITEQVWGYMATLLEAAIAMPDALRDYFIAYLRAAEHEANLGRLTSVLDAIRALFPDDDLGTESPAHLATWTIWLAYSAMAYSLAANSYDADDARQLLRRIVEAQCAPFEDGRTQ